MLFRDLYQLHSYWRIQYSYEHWKMSLQSKICSEIFFFYFKNSLHLDFLSLRLYAVTWCRLAGRESNSAEWRKREREREREGVSVLRGGWEGCLTLTNTITNLFRLQSPCHASCSSKICSHVLKHSPLFIRLTVNHWKQEKNTIYPSENRANNSNKSSGWNSCGTHIELLM